MPMSDVEAHVGALYKPYAKRPIRIKHPNQSLTGKRKQLVELMVYEAKPLRIAAEMVGYSYRRARECLTNPAVMQYYKDQLVVLRESERARNLATGVELRDTSGSDKVRLEAAKYLDGNNDRGGLTVNVGVQVGPPGYMVAAPPLDGEMLRLAGSTRTALDLQAED